MMNPIFTLALAILVLPHGLHAAPSAAAEKEYQQVRTIAMRDARVQAAYRDADRRLDEKIIRIDPALESYVKARQAAREGVPAPKPAPKPAAKPAVIKPFVVAKPAAKPAAVPAAAKSSASKTTHVVASGETLGGIAAKHRVNVTALKNANHIQDERKLRVGQTLTIPSAKGAPQPKPEQGGWSRLMH